MIDVRTLHIGAHVLVNGKRVEIESISNDSLVGYYTPDNDWEAVEPYRLEPIAITSELLAELGFEWRPKSSCWRKYKHISEDEYEWGLYVSNCNNGYWQIDLYLKDYRMNPKGYCKSLHELEAFLALCNVELIND